MDFFTVPTLTFGILYCFFVIGHDRRKILRNLLLSPAKDGKPVRFVVRLDGAAPGENSGIDTAQDGSGEIRQPRLYQLIRQKGPIVDRTFEIEFLDLSVHAFDFTFG